MELPLCLEEYEPELNLSVLERRRLITGLAEHGSKSIDDFIKEQAEDNSSGIANLVKRLRASLDTQANRMRERIAQKYKRKEKELKKNMTYEDTISLTGSESEDSSTKGGSGSENIQRDMDSRLVDILTQDNLLNFVITLDDDDEIIEKQGWWARFKAALRRAYQYIASAFRRLGNWFRSLFGKKTKTEAQKRMQKSNILLKFPSGSKIWDDMNHNLDNALATSPDFRRTIERDLNIKNGKKLPSRQRLTWKKGLNNERYSQEAHKEINRRIKRVIKAEQRKLSKKYERKRKIVRKREILSKDKSHREVQEREAEARKKQLEKQRSEELRKIKTQYSKRIHKSVQKELLRELEDIGYIKKDQGEEPVITTRLIDRFADIVLSDELSKLPSKYTWGASAHGLPHGIYEKKKLQTVSESSRMDIVASLVNSRVSHPNYRHIEDSDIITHSEMRSSLTHVVLIFDKSGSMEENNRINAAKKSVLALYKAIKHRNQQNIVDFIAFDSTVKVMDLLTAWRSTPSGFTNTSEALSTAHRLIKDSTADRKLIYLITDGLPEAFTDPLTGEPRAGDLEKSMKFTVKAAKKFKKLFGVKLTIILLEPEEEVYTEAADTIAKAAGGSVIVTDPHELATEMLMNYVEA
jgi:Mg-chelatase subunit ChlD